MRTNSVLFPSGDEVLRTLCAHADQARCVIFAGIPGTGKTLMAQQLSLLARDHGRVVHLLQWDVARTAFDRPSVLRRYPETGGVTHPVVRAAAGLWVRAALWNWHRSHPQPEHLLVGEAPLVGNRFVELARVRADPVEELLANPSTVFLVPAPNREVRVVIERARAQEMMRPRHCRESASASIDVLRHLWSEVLHGAGELGLPVPGDAGEYDPDIYLQVYAAVLRHRRHEPLSITRALPVYASAHEFGHVATELRASPPEVRAAVRRAAERPDGPSLAWFRT